MNNKFINNKFIISTIIILILIGIIYFIYTKNSVNVNTTTSTTILQTTTITPEMHGNNSALSNTPISSLFSENGTTSYASLSVFMDSYLNRTNTIALNYSINSSSTDGNSPTHGIYFYRKYYRNITTNILPWPLQFFFLNYTTSNPGHYIWSSYACNETKGLKYPCHYTSVYSAYSPYAYEFSPFLFSISEGTPNITVYSISKKTYMNNACTLLTGTGTPPASCIEVQAAVGGEGGIFCTNTTVTFTTCISNQYGVPLNITETQVTETERGGKITNSYSTEIAVNEISISKNAAVQSVTKLPGSVVTTNSTTWS